MTHVRRHERVTRGRAVAVRAHERSAPPPSGADTVWDDGTWDDTSSNGSYWDDEQECWVREDDQVECSCNFTQWRDPGCPVHASS